ncbi:MAG TPA: type II secretion system secretin GspD [Candidatus Limnocylindrales bacterium]|nr:type II secretion system secretin GspD [Candidatus Limnocylindrales bacterium]
MLDSCTRRRRPVATLLAAMALAMLASGARAQDEEDTELAPPPPPAPARVAPPAAPTAAAAEIGDESIVLNFENADIREVIYSLAAAMNINYWIDPRVQGQVTVRTSGRLSREDLFPIFHQLLRNTGFTAVKTGDLYSIVPAEEGKTKIIGSRELAAENHFVMNVVKVYHVGADQMAQTITPFVSPGGDAIAFPRSNLLIITDVATNADRLTDLVHTFDTNTFAEMNAKLFKVEHAVLEDLAEELQSILEAYHAAETGSPAFLIPLPRLGAIALIAQDPAVVMAVDYWVGVLDVRSEAGGRRQVYVYRVENSKAADLAAVLSEVYGEGGGTGRGGRRGRSGDAAEAGLGIGGGLGRASGGGSSGRRSGGGSGSTRISGGLDDGGGGSALGSSGGGGLGSSGGGGLGSSRGSSRSGRGDGSTTRGGRGGGGGGGVSGVVIGGTEDDLFEQEVRVVEDEVTNSLVILATPRDYQTLRVVLRDLDIVPRQVLIESMIAEITIGENDTLSVLQSLLPNNSDTDVGTGDLGGGYFNAFGQQLRLIGELGSGGLLGTISGYRNGIEVYRGLLEAQSTRSRVKVLSRPHLMTTDNQEARILVGQEVPIITSQSDTDVITSGQSRFLQNVQYRDTGIIIRVLPQVNSEGLVNMELAQEVSEISSQGNSVQEISSPTFTTREAETTVVVHSGETIIIGGIISESSNEDRSGVPYLMDVPVLGQLFRSDNTNRRRTELIILITPFVVRDREEAQSVTEEFRRRVDRVLEDVEKPGSVDAGPHTLIIEQRGPVGEVVPAETKRPPVPQPTGGPIPVDFNRKYR